MASVEFEVFRPDVARISHTCLWPILRRPCRHRSTRTYTAPDSEVRHAPGIPTVWLPAESPDLEAARAWLDTVEDSKLLDPGSLGWAPHDAVEEYGMDVPDDAAFRDVLTEGDPEKGWHEALREHLGEAGRERYLSLARRAIFDVLEELDGLEGNEETDVLRLANGRLVNAAYETHRLSEPAAVWVRRLEMLKNTCPRELIDATGIVLLDGEAGDWALMRP